MWHFYILLFLFDNICHLALFCIIFYFFIFLLYIRSQMRLKIFFWGLWQIYFQILEKTFWNIQNMTQPRWEKTESSFLVDQDSSLFFCWWWLFIVWVTQFFFCLAIFISSALHLFLYSIFPLNLLPSISCAYLYTIILSSAEVIFWNILS